LAPLDTQHGIDPSQPKTILEVPDATVLEGILQLWKQTKKPVDLVVLMDISGSMGGDKISSARSSLIQFIQELDDRDRLQVTVFSDDITNITPLSELGGKRQQVMDSVSGIFEGGNTRLYDAVLQEYQNLQKNGDPKHIRAMVVLSDGDDTASATTLDQLLSQIQSDVGEGGNSIKLFTIAFGSDADKDILGKIANPTGGKEYDSSPENIQKIYDDIATFFLKTYDTFSISYCCLASDQPDHVSADRRSRLMFRHGGLLL